eukprot:9347373-Pyramimonas_sp.AAC.1
MVPGAHIRCDGSASAAAQNGPRNSVGHIPRTSDIPARASGPPRTARCPLGRGRSWICVSWFRLLSPDWTAPRPGACCPVPG